MIDPVILFAVSTIGGAAIATAKIPAAIAALGVAIVAWRRARDRGAGAARWVLVCAAIFVAQGARSILAIERARGLHARAVAAFTPPATCVARGVIVESPIASAREEEGALMVYTRAAIRVHNGACEDRSIPEGTVVRAYDLPDDLRRGDVVELTAKLLPVHLFEHAELPSPWPSIARSEIVASGAALDVLRVARPASVRGAIDGARAFVRRRILATYERDAAGLGRALVLGETDLAEEDVSAFRDSGLLHLLAVSGTHLVLVVSALAGLLRRLLVRVEALAARTDVGRVSSAVGIAIAWLYADFAGGSGSAVRAAAMLSVVLFARALGLRPTPGRALALGLAGAALVDPLVGLDMSFGLSAGATAGLVVLGGPLGERLTGWLSAREGGSRAWRAVSPALKHVLLSVATTLAATIGSTPALLRFSPRLPVLGVVANVVAGPLGELLALPVCLAHAVAAPFGPVERALALAGSGALLAVRGIARTAASAGGGFGVPPPSPGQIAAVVVATALFVATRDRRSRLALTAAALGVVLLLEGVERRAGAPHGWLRITALDVGQGDSLLIDFPDGRAMLIDGGGMVGNPVDPGTRVILPVLAARRRSRVDVLALTHPHPDHFTGLATVAKGLAFDELWETGQGEMLGVKGAYSDLLAAARGRGASIRRPEGLCGAPRFFGGARVEVLSPCPRALASTPANDASLVLRIDYGRRSALLVGDAEHEAERELLASGARLGADLLKVGHHGSRTSSSAGFLRAVGPGFAMISCGVRNRFGHPHPAALGRLAETSALVLRTDQGGEIVWETDGEEVRTKRP